MRTVQKRLALRASLAAMLLVMVGSACAQIAGIEDRNAVSEPVNSISPECEEYCDLVEGPTNNGVCPDNYTTLDVCLGVCDKLPPGELSEPTAENTIACRLNAARAVKTASDAEKPSYCQAAGPGGNGACGSNCESYCMLVEMDEVCGDRNLKVPDCVDKCAAFGDSQRFHVGTPTEEFDHSGDTVQCRLVHVSTAAGSLVTDALKDTHCPHADFHSSQWCQAEEVTCSRYCDVLEVACVGDNSVYENRDQCEAACAELDLGEPEEDTSDTIGCRTYHAVSSLSDPSNHCSHAGPTGDGHCGTDTPADPDEGTPAQFAACRPYCRLLEAGCPTEFAGKYANGDDCVEQCDASPESFGAKVDQDYTVESAKDAGDTLICGTFYAVRALGDPENAAEYCPSAFGAAPCD